MLLHGMQRLGLGSACPSHREGQKGNPIVSFSPMATGPPASVRYWFLTSPSTSQSRSRHLCCWMKNHGTANCYVSMLQQPLAADFELHETINSRRTLQLILLPGRALDKHLESERRQRCSILTYSRSGYYFSAARAAAERRFARTALGR